MYISLYELFFLFFFFEVWKCTVDMLKNIWKAISISEVAEFNLECFFHILFLINVFKYVLSFILYHLHFCPLLTHS